MENIILTGYMGSGKTSVGKNIAKLVRYTFVDTDEMIVEQQRRSISDIFATDGEQAFRDMETALLRRLIDEGRAQLVISALGRVVYLKASPGTIYNRIKGDTTRPLLQCRNPMRRIEEMLAVRGPLYEEGAMFTVDVNKLRQSEAAEACIRYLRSAGCVFV